MPFAFLAYNPTAGRFPSGIQAESAAEILQENGWNLHLEKTHSGEDITRLARLAAEEKADAFFIIGGDGSINRSIEGLAGTETALGVLPAGTANVWAQEIGLPGLAWTRWMAIEESIHRLADPDIRYVDVGDCNGRPFLLWAGVGIDGFIVHRIEPRTPWEKHFSVIHYMASAAWSASFWPGMDLLVEGEGISIQGRYMLALVSNIHLYAGGLANISPDALLDDGMMDLWLFEGDTVGSTVQHVMDMLSGRHLQSDKVRHLPFRSLRMESEPTLYIQVDGEPVFSENPVSIDVRPQALKVLVPRQTPRPLFVAQKKYQSDQTQ